MTDIARQPPGIPTGGQFAAASHRESGVTLPEPKTYTAEYAGKLELKSFHFDRLPEWPEAVPVPEVSYDFDNGKVNTYLSIDGYEPMKFWTDDGDGTMNSTDIGEPHWADFHDEDAEAALAWGKEVHERIDSSLYGVMLEAGYNADVQAAVIAHATGAEETPDTTPDLSKDHVRSAYREAARKRLQQAEEEVQRVHLLEKALKLKEKFPYVGAIELRSDPEYVTVVGASDREGNTLGKDVVEALNQGLFAWEQQTEYDFIIAGYDVDEDTTIDIDEAVAWRPKG